MEDAQSQFFHVRDCIRTEKDEIADEEVYGVEGIEREEFDEAANDVQEMLRAELAEPIRILEDGHPERR